MSTASLRADVRRLRERGASRRRDIPEDRAGFAAAVGLPDLDPWQTRLLG